MANQYTYGPNQANLTTISERDLGGGIDAKSAENRIPESRVETCLNGETNAQGTVRKRNGYQGYAGMLPFRVVTLEQNNTDHTLTFQLPSGVNASNLPTTPIVVSGVESGLATSPFSTKSEVYFPTFEPNLKKTIQAGTHTLALTAEHGYGTPCVFCNIGLLTDATTKSYELVIPNSVSINKTSTDISIGYTSPTSGKALAMYIDKTPVGGSSYVSTLLVGGGGTSNFSITQATHGLSDFNIVGRVFIDNGTTLEQVIPDSFSVNLVTGDVSVSVSGPAANYRVVLSAVDAANIESMALDVGSFNTLTINNPTNPYLFPTCYMIPSPGTMRQVMPDSVVYNESLDTLSITFGPGIGIVYVYYEYGEVKSNSVVVSYLNAVSTGSTSDVSLSLWGLDHAVAYGTSERPGWVTHLDTYLSDASDHMIAGLGGVEHTALPTSIVRYPRLSHRIDTAVKIAPAFWDKDEVTGIGAANIRTRGILAFTDALSHWARIETITNIAGFQSRALVYVPNWEIQNGVTFADVFGTDDLMIIEGAGYSKNNGTFSILSAASVDADHITIDFLNPNVTDSDYNESNIAASVGIFTDILPIANNEFAVGDMLFSDVFDEGDGITVVDTDGLTRDLIVSNVIGTYDLPVGLRVAAIRTSNLVPIRAISGTPDATDLVVGDQLLYAPYNRYLTIKSINPNDNESTNITYVDSTTVTVLVSDSTKYYVGQALLLVSDNSTYECRVSALTDATTLELTSTDFSPAVFFGLIVGHTVEIDESLGLSDISASAFSMSVPLRWYPVEVPTSTQARIPLPKPFIFDDNSYTQQPTVRSVMMNDCMYLSNGSDPVFKYDGASNYRAGFVRWQAGCFLTVDTTAAGKITIPTTAATVSADTGAVLTMAAVGDTAVFVPGDRVVFDSDPTYINTVKSIDTVNKLITLAVAPSVGGGTTLSLAARYSYYFRLNAVDAKNNVIASATTGIGDHIANLTQSAAIYIKLAGLPPFDAFDYDRIELEIYRTHRNGIAPYYRVATLPVSYATGEKFVTYTDTASDDSLSDLDAVNSALLGNEVGTTWEGPIRSKYMTSIQNRLILANLTDWQSFDLRFFPVQGVALDYSAIVGTSVVFSAASGSTDTMTYTFVDETSAVAITGIADDGSGLTEITTGGHTLVAGDWVYLYRDTVADANRIEFAGHYKVLSVDGAKFTIDQAFVTIVGNSVDKVIYCTTQTEVPVLLYAADGNFSQSNQIDTSGTFDLTNAMRRLAIAINATSSTPMWLTAGAGSGFARDQLIVRKPISDGQTMQMEVVFDNTKLTAYVNGFRVTTGTPTAALEKRFGSRIIMSYPNFPEIFDSPTVDLDKLSDSAIDINPTDGQEITGIIPFFGQSAFGAALTDGPLLVLKTNSVYVVDIATKTVKKLDTRGLGCTLPFTVAASQKGIMFGNESGVYQISRDLSLKYIGFNIERIWQQQTTRISTDACGHHFGIGSTYKLTVEAADTDVGHITLVYDHTREDLALTAPGTGDGAWALHTAIPAVGWANFGDNEFYARTDGRVWIRRNAGDSSDFRDGDQAINFELVLRAMDFGVGGIRKHVRRVVTHFRAIMEAVSTKVYEAFDMGNEFIELDDVKVRHNDTTDGLSTLYDKKVYSVVSTPAAPRCQYFQLKYVNAAKDEGIELCGVDFRVKGLSSSGITQAAKS